MSYAEALRIESCTRCFGCCYMALDTNELLDLEDMGIVSQWWIHIPIVDGTYDFLTICATAVFDKDLTPSCAIQNEKPKWCIDYRCWEDV